MKLELNHKEKFGRNSNTWKLRTILLKNDWVNQEIKNQFKQFLETNENENTSIQNLWDSAKAVLRGKYIAIQASLKRIEKSKMQFLYSHLKKLELEQKNRPNPCTRRQLIKIRAEISELETRNKTRSWYFERINKIDKPVADLFKRIEKGPKLIKL